MYVHLRLFVIKIPVPKLQRSVMLHFPNLSVNRTNPTRLVVDYRLFFFLCRTMPICLVPLKTFINRCQHGPAVITSKRWQSRDQI